MQNDCPHLAGAALLQGSDTGRRQQAKKPVASLKSKVEKAAKETAQQLEQAQEQLAAGAKQGGEEAVALKEAVSAAEAQSGEWERRCAPQHAGRWRWRAAKKTKPPRCKVLLLVLQLQL